jgi:PAS domain S-box-containing protein
VREHFGMDVAFVCEFVGGNRVFRFVDAETDGRIVPGTHDPLEASYCRRVVDGTLPSIIADAQNDPLTRELPVTLEQNVGSYLGVPITFPDGRIYGTLCCLGDAPVELGIKELAALTLVADVVSAHLQRIEDHLGGVVAAHDEVADIIDNRAFHPVFQPIVDLQTGELRGVEALTRFQTESDRPPNEWFAAAAEAGLGVELELAVLRSALDHLEKLPESVYLSVNLAPEHLRAALPLLLEAPCSRLVVELTEHAEIVDYGGLIETVDELRTHGVRMAVDDAGSGYASLAHVLRLRPDIVKLDLALVRDVDTDLVRQALARALVEFAANFGATIVAEGIETAAELRILARLGVACGQGYHLARPAPLPLPELPVLTHGEPLRPPEVRDAVHYVFRKNPMAVTIATAEGRFVVVNEAAAQIYGRPIDEFPGRSWDEFWLPENVDAMVEAYTRVINGETDAAVMPATVPRPDGTTVAVTVTGRAIRDADGGILWFVNVLEPIGG